MTTHIPNISLRVGGRLIAISTPDNAPTDPMRIRIHIPLKHAEASATSAINVNAADTNDVSDSSAASVVGSDDELTVGVKSTVGAGLLALVDRASDGHMPAATRAHADEHERLTACAREDAWEDMPDVGAVSDNPEELSESSSSDDDDEQGQSGSRARSSSKDGDSEKEGEGEGEDEDGPDWMFADDEKKAKDPTYTFCPAVHRKQILRLFTRHFCRHSMFKNQTRRQRQTPVQIRRGCVRQMYTFCKARGLREVWAYMWNQWYRPPMWRLWARSTSPRLSRLRTTMTTENHWKQIKHDYLLRETRFFLSRKRLNLKI